MAWLTKCDMDCFVASWCVVWCNRVTWVGVPYGVMWLKTMRGVMWFLVLLSAACVVVCVKYDIVSVILILLFFYCCRTRSCCFCCFIFHNIDMIIDGPRGHNQMYYRPSRWLEFDSILLPGLCELSNYIRMYGLIYLFIFLQFPNPVWRCLVLKFSECNNKGEYDKMVVRKSPPCSDDDWLVVRSSTCNTPALPAKLSFW